MKLPRAGDDRVNQKVRHLVSTINLKENASKFISNLAKPLRRMLNKLYAGGHHDMPRPSPPPWAPKRLRRRADGNVAAVSNGQQVPTPTAAAA